MPIDKSVTPWIAKAQTIAQWETQPKAQSERTNIAGKTQRSRNQGARSSQVDRRLRAIVGAVKAQSFTQGRRKIPGKIRKNLVIILGKLGRLGRVWRNNHGTTHKTARAFALQTFERFLKRAT